MRQSVCLIQAQVQARARKRQKRPGKRLARIVEMEGARSGGMQFARKPISARSARFRRRRPDNETKNWASSPRYWLSSPLVSPDAGMHGSPLLGYCPPDLQE